MLDNVIIEGLSLFQLTVYSDHRGSLMPFEIGTNLPFPMRRFFCINVVEPGITRAEHCSSAEELLVVLCGAAECDADNGAATASVRLQAGATALWVRPGVWIRLRDFLPNSVIGVMASLSHADTHQQPAPNRSWLASALAQSGPA